jgi:FixJ family two-component response regulator
LVRKLRKEARLIAIVDDDESVREATTGLIRSMGLAAEAFASGEDFLRFAHVGHVVCLVADVNMPGMSGLDLHRHIAALPKRIPTILITAYPSESIRECALRAGIVCFLVKPFSDDELLKCIRSALGYEGEGAPPQRPVAR